MDPETVILEVTATDPDPSLARDIAQAYAQQVKLLVARLETPDGKSTPLVTASITSTTPRSRSRPSARSRCATWRSPLSWGCCWASASP